MPKNFIRKTYNHWIKKNRHRFFFRPWIVESRKHIFTLRFDGIAPELTCCIDKTDGIMFIHDRHGQYWDLVAEFEVIAKRTQEGKYYCYLCEDFSPPALLYATRTELWEDHVFEEMLAWANGMQPDIQIWLYGSPEITGWGADLLSKNVAHQTRKKYHTCFPIVRMRKNLPNSI